MNSYLNGKAINSLNRPTVALCIDMSKRKIVKEFKNIDAILFFDLAREMGAKAIVLAGQLSKKDSGCFAAMVTSTNTLHAAINAANTRMSDAGSDGTAWLISLNDPDMQSLAKAAVATDCGHIGGVQ